MQTTELKDHDEGRPTDPRIAINPKNWGSKTEPQACETPEGNWLYNKPASELFGDKVPDNKYWKKKIKDGWKPTKLAGNRDWNNGQYYLQGTDGYYWSSSPTTPYSYYAYFSAGGGTIADNHNRGYGFSLRLKK